MRWRGQSRFLQCRFWLSMPSHFPHRFTTSAPICFFFHDGGVALRASNFVESRFLGDRQQTRALGDLQGSALSSPDIPTKIDDWSSSGKPFSIKASHLLGSTSPQSTEASTGFTTDPSSRSAPLSGSLMNSCDVRPQIEEDCVSDRWGREPPPEVDRMRIGSSTTQFKITGPNCLLSCREQF
jgi:hypothetical protein